MENVFCKGCAEKEIQALVTWAPSVLTGGTVWLQVNERIPKDLPHFVFLWCFLTECQMWSLFKWCPAFILLALISATTGVVVPNYSMWNMICLKWQQLQKFTRCFHTIFFILCCVQKLNLTALSRGLLHAVAGISITHGNIKVEGRSSVHGGMRSKPRA